MRVNPRMTRDELLQHCRETIKNQRPSNIVERAAINGQTVGDNGEVVILHEYVMRLMVETRMPLCNSDITTLKDYANGMFRLNRTSFCHFCLAQFRCFMCRALKRLRQAFENAEL